MVAIVKLLFNRPNGLLKSVLAFYLFPIEIILAALFGWSFKSSIALLSRSEKRLAGEPLFYLIIFLAGNLIYFLPIMLSIPSYPSSYIYFLTIFTSNELAIITGGLLLFASLLLIRNRDFQNR